MTPLRQQYLRIKKQFPDTIVMFRLGDFYETFDDDAKMVSSVCNIVLTLQLSLVRLGEATPLGVSDYQHVPHHSCVGLNHRNAQIRFLSPSQIEPKTGGHPGALSRSVAPIEGGLLSPTTTRGTAIREINRYLVC